MPHFVMKRRYFKRLLFDDFQNFRFAYFASFHFLFIFEDGSVQLCLKTSIIL